MKTPVPWFDRALGALAPRTALKRALARQSFEALSRGYDGAAKGRRTDGWRAAGNVHDFQSSTSKAPSNQEAFLESQMIQLMQHLIGQTLRSRIIHVH